MENEPCNDYTYYSACQETYGIEKYYIYIIITIPDKNKDEQRKYYLCNSIADSKIFHILHTLK